MMRIRVVILAIVAAVATTATPGAAFFVYASVVDNGTNDPIFVPGR